MTDTNEQANVEPTTDETVEDVTTESTEPSIEDMQKQIDTLKAQKDHWKTKANSTPEPAPETAPAKKAELSTSDILAVAKADIHEEDIERVTKFADMEGISVKDALGNEDMKAILERRAENRKAAQAANTQGSQGASPSVSGETLAKSASANNMPDPEDLSAMWDAQRKK